MFIDKKELLATPVEVPGLQMPLSGAGQGDMMGGLERVLTQVNGILSNGVRLTEQIQAIRSNSAKINAAIPGDINPNPQITSIEAAPLQTQPRPQPAPIEVPSAPPLPQQPAPQAAPYAPQPGDLLICPALNEPEAKLCTAELMRMIATAEEGKKNLTLNQISMAYSMIPGQKEEIERLVISQLKAWLPRLVKP